MACQNAGHWAQTRQYTKYKIQSKEDDNVRWSRSISDLDNAIYVKSVCVAL